MFAMQAVKNWRQREISGYFRIMKQLRQLSKERAILQTKNLFDCVTLRITQKSRRSGNSCKQDFLDTALECSAKFAEKLADPPVLKVDYFFEESDLEAELSRSKKYVFSTVKEDFKVPSTFNFEISVWVNACRDAMQNCRRIAATNTVILMDDQVNEASASSGKHAARDVTLTAKGNFVQGHMAIPEGSWSIDPCSRYLPSDAQSIFPRWQPDGQGTKENVNVKERYHGLEHIGYNQKKNSPNMTQDCHRIRFLLRHSPVKQTMKVMKVVWREDRRWRVSRFIKGFIIVFAEKNLCTSEFYKVIPARILIYRRSLTPRLKKDTPNFCIILDSREAKIQWHQGDLYQEVSEKTKGGKQCTSHSCRHWIHTQTKSASLNVHTKNYHDRLCVINLEAAQESLDFYPRMNGSVLCYDTVLAEFLIKIIDNKDGSGQFVKEDTKEEVSSPTKRSPRDQGKPRKISWHDVKQKLAWCKTKSIRRCVERFSAGNDFKNNWDY